MRAVLAVYLEIGSKRTFAGAVDWPGWCRSGRGDDEALKALVAYGARYSAVVRRTSLSFTAPADPSRLEVIERLQGGSGTDFGVPGVPPSKDDETLDDAELARQQELLQASWDVFDAAAEAAEGIELRKGPRGGGRDLGKIVVHVLEAEEAYLTQLGSRHPKDADPTARMTRVRETALGALAARARGEPVPQPSKTRRLWTPRYFVRRAAWHVLDHAWEIQDRATGA